VIIFAAKKVSSSARNGTTRPARQEEADLRDH
jgi:hypothetical protein